MIMNILRAILCYNFIIIVSAQIQQIPAPKLAGGEKFQPWVNPGPPYTDTKQIKTVVESKTEPDVIERKIQNSDYKLFLPGLGIVKDYVPEQLSTRPQRESSKQR